VTINYPNGAVLKAIALSHDEHEIRTIAPGCEDALAFTCIHGAWISERLEPVTIEFEWYTATTHERENGHILFHVIKELTS